MGDALNENGENAYWGEWRGGGVDTISITHGGGGGGEGDMRVGESGL